MSRWPITKRVLVNTKTGQTFRGLLWAKKGPLLILRNVELLDRDRTTTVDGEVLIQRENVDWIQIL